MKYKSEIFEVIHQDAVEMFKIGAISEDRMREFDKMCLVKEPKAIYASEEPPKTEYAAVPQ
jgi:putative transcriptional regulator